MFSICAVYQGSANSHPGDIAPGCPRTVLALVPRNLLWPFLFILAMFTHEQGCFLSFILFSFIVPFADVPVERFGNLVLSLPPLQPVFTQLYQTPFIGLTRFNNTMVAGSFTAGVLAYLPVYLLVRILLSVYRKKLQPLITNSKLYKLFTRIPLIKKITDMSGIGGMHS